MLIQEQANLFLKSVHMITHGAKNTVDTLFETRCLMSSLDFCLPYSKNNSTEMNVMVTGEN